jgi:hypothetical protein
LFGVIAFIGRLEWGRCAIGRNSFNYGVLFAQPYALTVGLSRFDAAQANFLFQDQPSLDYDYFFHNWNNDGAGFSPHRRN